jgi:hypothetical protein
LDGVPGERFPRAPCCMLGVTVGTALRRRHLAEASAAPRVRGPRSWRRSMLPSSRAMRYEGWLGRGAPKRAI